jgi:UDP:flavonoid glycosyltransferase YjiC (YdhE family)
MKISVLAMGSRGDVQPPAALAATLVRRGHAVKLIAPNEFASLADGHGIQFCGLGGDVHQMVRDVLAHGKNPVSLFTRIAGEFGKLGAEWTQAMRDYASDADILVGIGGGAGGAEAVGQVLGKPYVIGFLQPILPTGDFPSPSLPPFDLPRWANRAEHWLAFEILWQAFRPLANRVRRQVLGLGPVPLTPFKYLYRDGYPVLIAVSPSVFPQPKDWNGRGEMTGYWYLDSAAGYRPPDALAAFLANGSPPVYFGFGSMTLAHPKETVETILAAVKRVGCRALISAGWAGLTPEHVTPDVYAGDNLPHDWLLPRMASVCHHGGAGTAAAAMRAGKPSIVVPFFADQPFFGWWLEKLGVAPRRLREKQLTVERLSRAIDRTLNDKTMRANAAALGEKIRAEDGNTRAAQLIEMMARRPN